jgi:hypothetical protein
MQVLRQTDCSLDQEEVAPRLEVEGQTRPSRRSIQRATERTGVHSDVLGDSRPAADGGRGLSVGIREVL